MIPESLAFSHLITMAQHTLNAPMWTAISTVAVTFGVQQVSIKQQTNLKQTAIIGENVTKTVTHTVILGL